ncbi:aldo/keto reductase [Bacillus sp. AFS002410]|uniref:aldo/keto reductase n=1 Tax=Bacillus sp. AFS002410 TaxID=2033481 RepID=UPI000BF1D910|nr:aldo/keto reductase [Bacillus sp. AFS002410]PEJ56564.1 aldo/keto reductase [Bacillus sp. AFS002410]
MFIKERIVGQNGPLVSEIGLGCMGMSWLYGETDRNESIATIQEALESGITLLDTGDFYGNGHNEVLIREALRGFRRENMFISVKFDSKHRSPGDKFGVEDNRPEAIKDFLKYTLQRLGTDYIDLYQPARIDPSIPIEETIGAISDLVKEGYVRHIGLSEVGAKTIRRAHAIHPLSWVQSEYSLFNREIELEILPTIRELGITLSAYGVLSRGLLSGAWTKDRIFSSNDKRMKAPRFTNENLEKNLMLVEALREIALEKHIPVSQLAIGWVLSKQENVIPLVGARKRTQLREMLGVDNLDLSPEDLVRIENAVPQESVAGEYYAVPRKKWFL